MRTDSCEEDCSCDEGAGPVSGSGPAAIPAAGAEGSAPSAGEPVEIFSGKFFSRDVDLVVNGVFPIRMVRLYDSQSTYDSPLGYGWSFNYNMQLFEYPNETIIVRTACGERDRYVPSAPPGLPRDYTLLKTEFGRGPDLVAQADGSYELTHPTGRRVIFDSLGRLSSIVRPDGHSLEFDYYDGGGGPEKMPLIGTSPNAVDPTAPLVVAYNYRLKTIKELRAGVLTGREVEFLYDAQNGRLDKIVSDDDGNGIDPGDRTVDYRHELQVELPTPDPTTTTGNLVEVVGLEFTKTYAYGEGGNAPDDLTSFTTSEGATPHVLDYDNEDRVSTQSHGATIFTFDYTDSAQTPGVDRSVTRDWVDAVGPRSATTSYVFNAEGFLESETDPFETLIEYRRGEDQSAYGEATPDEPDFYIDRVLTSEWDGQQHVLVREVRLDHDASGNLTERAVTLDPNDPSPETITESWEYDNNWVSAHQFVSDAAPSKIFRTEFGFDYDVGSGRPMRVKEVRRRRDDGTYATTAFAYNADGQLETITPPEAPSPDGLAIKLEYFPLSDPAGPGLLKKVALRVDDLTSQDPDGKSEIPQGRREFTYDDRGFIATVLTPSGQSSFTYDDLGRQLTFTNSLQETTTITYSGPNEGAGADPGSWPGGPFIAQVEIGSTAAEQTGQTRVLRYDALGRLVALERRIDSDPAVAPVELAAFTHDSVGNRLSATDARGESVSFAYDDLDRLVSTADNAPTPSTLVFDYDVFGNRTSVINGLSHQTTFEYDELDRLEQTENLAAGVQTLFEHDAVGNVTAVIDGGSQTTYVYDSRSRLEEVEQPLGQTVLHEYDDRSRLTKLTNARLHVLRFAHESWGGLATTTHHDTDAGPVVRTISFTYDDSGNLTSVSDDELPTGVAASGDLPADRMYTFTPDALDRIDSVAAHYLPGGDRTLDSRFDRFGNRDELRVIDPAEVGGELVHAWTYGDFLNRLDSAIFPGGQNVSFDYYENDRIEQRSYDSGVVVDYTYFSHGRVDTIVTMDGPTQLLSLDYAQPDAASRITGLDEMHASGAPTHSYTYGYDQADRLTSGVYPAALGLSGPDAFTYDAAANREVSGDPGAYDYDSNNRMIESPFAATLCYDDDGNLISKRSSGDCVTGTVAESFVFDKTNRLEQWSDGTEVVDFRYDPFGRRLSKTVDPDGGGGPAVPETTWYLWDGDQLLAEYLETGASQDERQRRYAYARGFAPVHVAEGAPGAEVVYDVHTDHLDTPRMLTNTSGTAVWRAAYEAFGEVPAAALLEDPDGDFNSLTFNIRFPGQYYDEETGLHYNRFRYYDPSVGRYVNTDPIGQAGGLNLFAYAALDPIGAIDPSGLMPPLFTPDEQVSPGRAATQLFAIDTQARNFARAQNDLSDPEKDALQHCVASCEAAKELGANTAAAAGTANEWKSSGLGFQTTGDRAMDDHNNGVGRQIGAEKTCPPPDCGARCLAALPSAPASGGPPLPLTAGTLDISRHKSGRKYNLGGSTR